MVQEASVSQDDLFLRKLVDTTLLSGQLYMHLSHESDDQAGELIYIIPFNPDRIDTYGNAIQAASVHNNTTSSSRIEYLLWNGASFHSPPQPFPEPIFKRDIAVSLLNHYLVFRKITYEVLHSIYDPIRDSVLLFLKEAEEDEQ